MNGIFARPDRTMEAARDLAHCDMVLYGVPLVVIEDGYGGPGVIERAEHDGESRILAEFWPRPSVSFDIDGVEWE